MSNEVAVMERRLAVLGHVVVNYDRYSALLRDLDKLLTARELLAPVSQNEYGDIIYEHADGEACETHIACPVVRELVAALLELIAEDQP